MNKRERLKEREIYSTVLNILLQILGVNMYLSIYNCFTTHLTEMK